MTKLTPTSQLSLTSQPAQAGPTPASGARTDQGTRPAVVAAMEPDGVSPFIVPAGCLVSVQGVMVRLQHALVVTEDEWWRINERMARRDV